MVTCIDIVMELVKVGAKLDLQDEVQQLLRLNYSIPLIHFSLHFHCVYSEWRLGGHLCNSGAETGHSKGASKGRE